ncbi:MAG: membrane protein insertase YidC [Parafilimonas sp.]
MKTDKNTVIGIVLLAVLFFSFFWYTNKQQQTYLESQQHIKDSLARVNAANVKPADKVAATRDSIHTDSIAKQSSAGNFANAASATEQLTTIENEVFKVTFTNKGGRVKYAELKNYLSNDGKPVRLGGGAYDNIGYTINTSPNSSAGTSELFFTASAPVRKSDGNQLIIFSLENATGSAVVHQFLIKPNDYKIAWNILLSGADKLLSNNTLNMQFRAEPVLHESSVEYERRMSNVCFSVNNEFDYISAHNDEKFDQPVQWLSAVQQFFNVSVIAKNNFNSGTVHWTRKEDSSNIIGNVDALLQIKTPASASVTIPLELYYGPNDYKILQTAAPEMDKIINLGRDFYSFVRPINKYMVMPVFNFFASFVSIYGWVIALLTIFIRLITSPLVYKSYLSGSKMKLLRPELDTLRKKYGSDQQAFSMEQMKLFKGAGVNPLGGCLPLLLQIPIFFALYSFFNSNIALRNQPFLWTHDLSAYDILVKFHTKIFIIGDHISLFALLAVVTSFLISLYNMNMTATDPNNPALKYMPYIYPVFMFIIFNNLPAALNWYYTVSNVITLAIQFVIQRYIIDHDKILAQMDAKRKAPKAKSKWQERYEQMMESQKKVQGMKQKAQNTKK